MDIGINGPAVEDQGFLLEEDVEVGPREAGVGHLSSGDILDLRLPVVFETDATPHPVAYTGPKARPAGIGEVGAQAVAPPGLVYGAMPAVMFAGRAEVVPYWRPTADGEDFMDLDGGV